MLRVRFLLRLRRSACVILSDALSSDVIDDIWGAMGNAVGFSITLDLFSMWYVGCGPIAYAALGSHRYGVLVGLLQRICLI